jgi:hypothetical protein
LDRDRFLDFDVVVSELMHHYSPLCPRVTALCGIAAMIGNRVRIRPKQNDDWEVVPNLRGAIIGRLSAMKSPAMTAALAPIYAIADDLRKKWEEAIESAEIDDALSGLDAKDAKKKAEKALKIIVTALDCHVQVWVNHAAVIAELSSTRPPACDFLCDAM